MISLEVIERRIFLIRGKKVMLDFHLAELYGVPTKRLNEQVRRNVNRFPEDFMFELTQEESESLRSQIATSKINRGGKRYFPSARPKRQIGFRIEESKTKYRVRKRGKR